jgi:hypothetical protein
LRKKEKFLFEKGNYNLMNEYFSKINWDHEFSNLNVNETYNKWLSIYHDACSKFVPKLKQHENKRIKDPLWMNRNIKNKCKKKRVLWIKCRNNKFKNIPEVEEYKVLNKEIKNLVKTSIKEYENKLAIDSKNNPKSVYAYINSKTKAKDSIKALYSNEKTNFKNNGITTDGYEMASILNDFFVSVFTKEDTNNIPKSKDRQFNECMEPKFSAHVIKQHLEKLNTSKAIGADMVHPKVLKSCSAELAYPLSKIFEKSFETGSLPEMWLKANIIPLFKKGNKLDPTNYRPISLTSIVCKIMEGIIKDEIMKFLTTNNLIKPQQHGFVNNKSCITNLLETLDLITKALADGLDVDVLFMDFAKAFDSVAHLRLLVKLEALGIRCKTLNWCKGFLSNRLQRVVLGEQVSEWKSVLSGVPQGSVLGPLLFVIFINDLCERLNNTGKLFADDTKVISMIKSQEDNLNLQNDINELNKWSNEWLIKFNEKKCKVMHFGKNNPNHEYKINEYILEKTQSEKDLGITITNDLNWKSHINNAINKANRQLGLIKHSFKYLNETTGKLLYKSLVRPHLEYGAVIWSPFKKEEIDKIERVQHRATKLENLKGLSYEERINVLNIPTLENRRKRGDLIQMYKIAKGYDKINFHNPIRHTEPSICSRRHNKRIRREILNKGSKNETIRHNFFTNRISNDWNSLTQTIIDSETINSFKKQIDSLLKF